MSLVVTGSPLTRRQREILRLAALGHGNREIARRLGCSPSTVRHHVANALVRLEVGSRAEAWRVLGWLEPPARA